MIGMGLMFKKRKKNNKGYSLMELIVSFAILGFVAVAVLSVMNAGTSMFSSVDNEINLQSKSQIAMAQFQQYFLGCSKGICVQSFSSVEADESTSETSSTESTQTTEENQDIDGDFVAYVADENTVYAFRFCEEEQKIYFGESTIANAETELTKDNITSPFCSDVSAFSVRVIHTGTNAKSAVISLTVTSGQNSSKTYTTSQTFSFRNRPLYIGTADEGSTKLHTMLKKLTDEGSVAA